MLTEPDDMRSTLGQSACEISHFSGIAGRDEKDFDGCCLQDTFKSGLKRCKMHAGILTSMISREHQFILVDSNLAAVTSIQKY